MHPTLSHKKTSLQRIKRSPITCVTTTSCPTLSILTSIVTLSTIWASMVTLLRFQLHSSSLVWKLVKRSTLLRRMDVDRMSNWLLLGKSMRTEQDASSLKLMAYKTPSIFLTEPQTLLQIWLRKRKPIPKLMVKLDLL